MSQATSIAKTANKAVTTQPLCGPWRFAHADRCVAAATGVAVWAAIALVASGTLGGQTWHTPRLPCISAEAALGRGLDARLWVHVAAFLASIYALFASRYARLRPLLQSASLRQLSGWRERMFSGLKQSRVSGLTWMGEWLAFLPLLQIMGAPFLPLPLSALPLFAQGFCLITGLVLSVGVFVRALSSALSLCDRPPVGDWLAAVAFTTWQFILFPALLNLWGRGFQT